LLYNFLVSVSKLKQSILAFALIVCGAINATAQATPATFAPRTTGAELLTEMVMVQDTIVAFVEAGGNGKGVKTVKRLMVQH
jgi:hypothetical protein